MKCNEFRLWRFQRMGTGPEAGCVVWVRNVCSENHLSDGAIKPLRISHSNLDGIPGLLYRHEDFLYDHPRQPDSQAKSWPSCPARWQIQARVLFRQLFEKESSIYTYLLADFDDPEKPAVLMEPVDTTLNRDVNLVGELGLKLLYVMNTHVHADHITGAGLMKSKLPETKFINSKASGSKVDLHVEPGDTVRIGKFHLEVGVVTKALVCIFGR